MNSQSIDQSDTIDTESRMKKYGRRYRKGGVERPEKGGFYSTPTPKNIDTMY